MLHFSPASFLFASVLWLVLVHGLLCGLCVSAVVAATAPANPVGYDVIYSGRGEVRGAVGPLSFGPAVPTLPVTPIAPAVPFSVSPPSTSFVAAAPALLSGSDGLSGHEIRASVRGPNDGNVLHFSGPDTNTVFAADAIGSARDNTVYYMGGTSLELYGAKATEEATGNTVILTGGRVTMLQGGNGATGASGNRVEMRGGTADATGAVFGGYTQDGDALNNSVLVDGTPWVHTVAGGYSGTGVAANNVVELRQGKILKAQGGQSDDKSAYNNTVRISGSADVDAVFGGWAWQDATDNKVYISGGKVGSGGVVAGSSVAGDARGNVVYMEGGTAVSLVGGVSPAGYAENNSIIVTGGTVQPFIRGGVTTSGYAINNTVTISGNPDISGAIVYGGFSYAPATAKDIFTGNTLNVDGFQGKVGTVGFFEKYNFFLPAHIADGSVILELVNPTDLFVPAGKSVKVQITGMAVGGNKLNAGDTIHLMDQETKLVSSGVDLTGGSFNQGIAVSYNYALKATATTLDAVILGAEAGEDANSPTDGPAADSGLINGGADVVAGPGMDNALAAARLTRQTRLHPEPKGWGVGVFGVYTGGRTTYANADHLRINANHYVAGFTKLWDTGAAEILAGAYFDAGVGSYDNQRAGARAEGDSRYQGGGLLARYAVTRGALSGAYAEGTARAGAVISRYQSPDLARKAGQEVKSETVTPYYSAHAGLGWVLPLGENTALDLYGKFFWSRLDGSEQRLASDTYRFDPTDSYRARGEARLSHKLGNAISLFVGAAYEHEFGGEVQGKVYDFPVYGADIRGGTGIGEVGLSFTLGDEGNFAMDISGQGFVGQREGFAGQVRAQYAF